MRLDELKNERLETPEFIHNMIQEEVEKQVKKSSIISQEKNHRWKENIGRIAAAVAVCIVATSTVAYAGTKLYQMYLEKQGNYGVEIGIQASEDGNNMEIPKQIHDISIASEYIPEGMEWVENDSKFVLSYKDTPNEGGISITSALMDKDDLDVVIQDENVVESEVRMFGTYEGVYLRYGYGLMKKNHDKSFNHRIYMICPENYRVLTLYIGEDVSKEDAYRFAEGLVITEKEKMLETAAMEKWSDMIDYEELLEESVVTSAKIPIYQVGDTFGLSNATSEDKEGNYISYDRMTVCVDEVQITDDLQLLKEEYIPKEWKSAVNENGKLVKNHLSYIKSGDGIKSLDEVIDEQTVEQKLVYATVTYTNTTDKEMNHVLYLGSLMTLEKQKDGTYTIYLAEETAGEDYDYFVGNSVARAKEMDYYDVKEAYGNGSNYIPSLKAGESVQIHMAWIVNETDLQNLYLDLSGFGSSFEIHENVIDTGLVYIGR